MPMLTGVGIAALIAALAGIAGFPAGLWVARRGWSAAALLAAGMLMPSTLAYAGWGLVRAPGTFLGDWLERIGEAGHPEVVVFAGRGLAVVGLVCWSFPVAGLVSGVMLRRVDAGVFEAIRLEAKGRASRALAIARLGLPAIGVSMAVVFVLMLGSAVPLHLAQMPTLAIELWKLMDQTPQDQWWRVWLGAWPVAALAGGAAWAVASGARRGLEATGEAELGRGGSVGSGGAAGVWAGVGLVAAVVAPAVLLISSVRNPASFLRFWRVSGGAMADSLLVAGITGVAGLVLAMATAASVGLGGPWRRAAWVVLGVFVWMAAMPGVLIGSLLARGYAGAWARELTDSSVFVALGHVARFGVVGMLLGVWSVRAEARGQGELRVLDGAGTLAGYLRAGLPIHLPAGVCAGLCMGAMSLHEIEASVMLQPPGVENLAKQVLQMLHFSRMEELSVAVSYLVVIGSMVAGVAAWLVGWVGARLEATRNGAAEGPERETA
jgi:ABC-type Fe3+ transport system permease subunit